MLAAAEAFVSFSAAAATALGSSGASAQRLPAQGLIAQMMAATSALTSCLTLVGLIPSLTAAAAVRIGAACSLVLGPGCTLLGRLVQAVEAAPSSSQEALRGQANSLCACQLEAVTSTTLLLTSNNTAQAATAFAAGTAKPAALVPWLAAVVRAIRCNTGSCGSRAGEGKQAC